MLEVEDYAPPATSQRRAVSAPIRSASPDALLSSKGRTASFNVTSALGIAESVTDVTQTMEPIVSPHLDAIPYPSVSPPIGPSSLAKLFARSSHDIILSPPQGDLADLSVSPSSPPPAPIITPFEPRERTTSGHSHSLIRPSLVQPSSSLRHTDSPHSNHSPKPSISSNIPGYAVTSSPSKAIATTALADEAIMEGSPIPPQLVALPITSDTSSSSSPPPTASIIQASRDTATPSPTASASEGLSNVLLNRSRKRTISTKASPTIASPTGLGLAGASGAFATLTSGLRFSLGRRRRDSTAASSVAEPVQSEAESDVNVSVTMQRGTNDARTLLRKLDTNSNK